MATVDYICPKTEVLELFRHHKDEFHFTQRSDDDFIIFLLDTATRVLSIAQQLTPVLEAVATDNINKPDPTISNDKNLEPEKKFENNTKQPDELFVHESLLPKTPSTEIKPLEIKSENTSPLQTQSEQVDSMNPEIPMDTIPSFEPELGTVADDDLPSSEQLSKSSHQKHIHSGIFPTGYSMLDSESILLDSLASCSRINNKIFSPDLKAEDAQGARQPPPSYPSSSTHPNSHHPTPTTAETPLPQQLMFVRSLRGRPKLVHNGHVYTFQRFQKNGIQVAWRCVYNNKSSRSRGIMCSSVAVTQGMASTATLVYAREHGHPPGGTVDPLIR